MYRSRPERERVEGASARIVSLDTGYRWTQPTACDAVSVATPDEVLRVEHLSKRFAGVTALEDVSLRLRKGEALGLLGDNGSGKSTTRISAWSTRCRSGRTSSCTASSCTGRCRSSPAAGCASRRVGC